MPGSAGGGPTPPPGTCSCTTPPARSGRSSPRTLNKTGLARLIWAGEAGCAEDNDDAAHASVEATSSSTGWIHQAAPRHPMMSSPWAAAVFVAAAGLSLGASAVLVVRLERLGARLGLSEALLGLVAALAADTPEVTSAVTALAHGQHDIGTGVVLGSNVFNLAALIGLGAVVAGGIKLHRRVVLFEGTVALSIAALAIAAVTGLITAVAALALAVAVLAPYVYVSALHPSGRSALPLPSRLRSWLAGAVADEEQELSEIGRAHV